MDDGVRILLCSINITEHVFHFFQSTFSYMFSVFNA